jgi:hypothetical protein
MDARPRGRCGCWEEEVEEEGGGECHSLGVLGRWEGMAASEGSRDGDGVASRERR